MPTITSAYPQVYSCWLCSHLVSSDFMICSTCNHDHSQGQSLTHRKAELAPRHKCPNCKKWGHNHPAQLECEHCGWHPC